MKRKKSVNNAVWIVLIDGKPANQVFKSLLEACKKAEIGYSTAKKQKKSGSAIIVGSNSIWPAELVSYQCRNSDGNLQRLLIGLANSSHAIV